MLATFMEVLDTSIAAVALPYIAGSLSATNDEATWVLTSYLVANAIILAGQFMVFAALRAKKISDHLHHHLHDFVVRVRRGDKPGLDSDCARGAGRGRRSAAAAVAVDPAGNFSSTKARAGHGRVRPGCGGRAGAGADAGRMAHRYLLVALGVLHQHSRRHLRRIHDLALRGGSAVCERRASRQV